MIAYFATDARASDEQDAEDSINQITTLCVVSGALMLEKMPVNLAVSRQIFSAQYLWWVSFYDAFVGDDGDANLQFTMRNLSELYKDGSFTWNELVEANDKCDALKAELIEMGE